MTGTVIAGLGAMGSALARALLAAGEDVTVWNRSADKAAALASDGARIAESLAGAVAANPVTIFCVTSHDDTRALCRDLGAALHGKIVVDLSTGSAQEAAGLAADLESYGARWQLGMINVYPRDIGRPETSIYTVGPEDVWTEVAPRLRILGGASRHVGNEPAMLAALFASMFTTRQGFMFGMLFGATVARAAGLTAEVYAETLPVSLGLADDYAGTFRRTVPADSYADPGAAIATYAASFDDAVSTFESLGAPAGLPRLMRDLVHEGVAEGLGAEELTALYKMLCGRIEVG